MVGMTARAKAALRPRVSYPVENLRVQVSALETATAQVLAKPRKDAVHHLRSTTRRIEAHLEAIEVLGQQEPGFRAVEKMATQVKKLLDRIRRAAGRVRDLDVRSNLAQECSSKSATLTLKKEVKELRASMKAKRRADAAKLREVLDGHGRKLAPKLEVLLHALQPVANVGLSTVEQEVLTRDWYAEQVRKARKGSDPTVALHDIRKAAKLARYLAENGLAGRVVNEFKALQEAGGRWHDYMSLRDAARRQLGKRSELARLAREKEMSARSAFEAMLAD